MGKFLKHRRGYSLIVCMAILLNLFAPAIGHAMATLAGDPLVLEICSSSSSSAPTKPAPGDPATHAIKHCALCATHADTYAPPPAPSSALTVLRGHDAYPALHYQSPTPLFNWSSAQPRGPPALS
ncbi:DUF2946 domain-containing protein [Duganella sp. BJB488]|uniref:DUF2946 domain-containing protein n=1 Tax=unclassified Duganella TaxID=2636909 RepID=UPI000E34F31A|nr:MULTISPECIES: DUF2946 domain-containing protein [unclassified Duganella]RFP21655.1 DUF2946 domain-containing protein [Duganella sp. BJB489]RFP23448.1 DUF2946 domain-containing protein [Duganella sp. BJB488]RFP38614.1 DUF2946 domain-containing protein [Duganella sp. BJB480]